MNFKGSFSGKFQDNNNNINNKRSNSQGGNININTEESFRTNEISNNKIIFIYLFIIKIYF